MTLNCRSHNVHYTPIAHPCKIKNYGIKMCYVIDVGGRVVKFL